MHDDANILAALERIVMRLDALPRAIVAAQRRSGALPREPELLLALARAIYDVRGDRVFAVSELMRQAESPQADALRDAIANVVIGAEDPAKKLGQALRKAQTADLHGLRVVRCGEDKQGATWQVVTC